MFGKAEYCGKQFLQVAFSRRVYFEYGNIKQNSELVNSG